MSTTPRHYRVSIELSDFYTVDVVALDEDAAIDLACGIDPLHWKHIDHDQRVDQPEPISAESFDPPFLPASAWSRT